MAATGAAAQNLTTSAGLSFGAFVAGAGTVVVSPAGSRSRTGAVMLVPQGPGSAALLTITGTAGQAFSLTLPANDKIVLSNGTSSMAVNDFTANLPLTDGTLSSASVPLRVGATLSVSTGQPAGAYSGTFPVTVQFN